MSSYQVLSGTKFEVEPSLKWNQTNSKYDYSENGTIKYDPTMSRFSAREQNIFTNFILSKKKLSITFK
jgi:hypothetical protein